MWVFGFVGFVVFERDLHPFFESSNRLPFVAGCQSAIESGFFTGRERYVAQNCHFTHFLQVNKALFVESTSRDVKMFGIKCFSLFIPSFSA